MFKKVSSMAYRVALPPSLESNHNVFHVSNLRKYVYDPSYVMELESIQLAENLSYEEAPIQTFDTMDKAIRHAIVNQLKFNE